MGEAIAALQLAIRERDAARTEANTYYLALEAALARDKQAVIRLEKMDQLSAQIQTLTNQLTDKGIL